MIFNKFLQIFTCTNLIIYLQAIHFNRSIKVVTRNMNQQTLRFLPHIMNPEFSSYDFLTSILNFNKTIKEEKVNGQQMKYDHLHYQRPMYSPGDAHRHDLLL